MNEDIILSEYLDGELPADLAAMVQERLARDAAFKARHDAMAALRGRLLAAPGPDPVALADMQARGWQRLQRNLSPRPSRTPAWIAAFGDLVSVRVSLPVPALAALGLVFVAVGFLAVVRPGAGGAALPIAAAPGTAQVQMTIPSLGQSPTAAGQAELSTASLGADASTTLSGGSGMAVTIEVQNLRQLLSLLENNQGLREFTIQMPQGKSLQPVGDPALFSAAELETGNGK